MKDIIVVDGVEYKRIGKQSIAKYKIGDWVRVISNKSGRPDDHHYIGEIAQISAVFDCWYDKGCDDKVVHAYSIGKTCTVFEDELELVEEPVEKSKQDPFDIKAGDWYHTIVGSGIISSYVDSSSSMDKKLFSVANACKDEDLMRQRALHEILNRLLWRASIKAGELDNPWDNEHIHWTIYCYGGQKFNVTCMHLNKYAEIYFPTKQSAQSALDDIVKPFLAEHPDFAW